MSGEEKLLRKLLGIGMGKHIELKLPEGKTAKDILRDIENGSTFSATGERHAEG